MQNPLLLRRVLMACVIVSLLVVVYGIYQVIDTSRRYDQLDAVPLQPLLDTAKENPTNAETIVLLDKQKRDTLVQRSEALSVIGIGAVLLGIVGFVFVRVPSPPQNPVRSS